MIYWSVKESRIKSIASTDYHCRGVYFTKIVIMRFVPFLAEKNDFFWVEAGILLIGLRKRSTLQGKPP